MAGQVDVPSWLRELRSQWKEDVSANPGLIKTLDSDVLSTSLLSGDGTPRGDELSGSPDSASDALTDTNSSATMRIVTSSADLTSSERSHEVDAFTDSPRNMSGDYSPISVRSSQSLGDPPRPFLRQGSMASKSKVDKALSTLKAFQTECDTAQKALVAEEQRFRVAVASDLQLYSRWSLRVLSILCRKHAELKFHLLTLQATYHGTAAYIIRMLFTRVRRCLDEGSPVDETADFMKGPKYVLAKSKRVLWLKSEWTRVETEFKSADKQYQAAKKASRPLSTQEWQRRMKQILLESTTDPLVASPSYCVPDDNLQARFNALVADERCAEGRRFWQLYDYLHKPESVQWTASDIVAFVERLAHDIAVQLMQVADEERIQLLLSRLVFSRLATIALHHEVSDEDLERDKMYEHNLTWLRNEPQTSFGVEVPFVGPTDGPYKPYHLAISALNELSYTVVPSDCFYAILRCAKLIYQQGTDYSGGKQALGADLLFPIFVWVTLHCDVPNMVSLVQYIRRFASSKESSSEMGYYLTTLEAAVEHITRITPEKFAANAVQTNHVN